MTKTVLNKMLGRLITVSSFRPASAEPKHSPVDIPPQPEYRSRRDAVFTGAPFSESASVEIPEFSVVSTENANCKVNIDHKMEEYRGKSII